MYSFILRSLVLLVCINTSAQTAQKNASCYWQQHVDYNMAIDMDVENYRYTGKQELVYTNNSPDTLDRVFYHLYFNAFQPGSEMDHRLQALSPWDKRISELQPYETGYIKVQALTQDGKAVNYKIKGTILEVSLAKPVKPGTTTKLIMDFSGQVPVLVKRAGRNSDEGVVLSMTQWYPKMAEYDVEGWHSDPYLGREFYGVWGNFDVKITIDKNYILGGTGYLRNAAEIGYGYEKKGTKVKRPKGKKLTWHFVAPNVHDFAWGADPEYIHDVLETPGGTTLHFLYKNDPGIIGNWKKLQPETAKFLDFYNANIGPYPWKQYSVIQGGDGGMEYAMCTLIPGKGSFESLVEVTAHELAHAWFQHALATNESEYPWMDEGFTTFITDMAVNEVMGKKEANPFKGVYGQYFALRGWEQPLTTHADRYATQNSYIFSVYGKGAVFLAQLGYIMGQDKLMKTLRRYYKDFKFRHPTPNDFICIAEKVSGFQLDWYLTDWTRTTNTIDYGIKEVLEEGDKTKISLERIGLMPMPVDLLVTYKDGFRESFYIPLRMMRSVKENLYPDLERTVLPDWPWANSTYDFTINRSKYEIKTVVIDPSGLMADVDKANNKIAL
ncbi:M1 family peptidase [Sinomicrobium pectinilyticum]|uniref:M1 family peptidase n=1 Tax=Sinomicrobium pectinilyticum TaxID=1084421 RepID=A0A3N0EIT6_SINP1|nr:M1 family metallopeptidase [Sinomicrobium pectinilyticum]RNL87793.1 M1 family peptidase [Sinomicrobium pectinilyticum]